jgi:ribonuclease BN (tRNA processing enzyme)
LTDGRDWNSILIDHRILLDLPPTAVPQMHRLGIDLSCIQWIFISHLHADHAFGLPFLLLEYCIRRVRSTPLHIIGPPGIEEYTFHLCDMAWPQLRTQGFEPKLPLCFLEVCREEKSSVDGLSFRAFPMQHFDLDAFGFRIEYRGRLIAYSGDTGECTQLERLLSGADVAILELTHPAASRDPGHMDAPSFARHARQLVNGNARVFATHMGATPSPIPGVDICEDGKTYWI